MTDRLQTNDAAQSHQPFQVPEHCWANELFQQVCDTAMKLVEKNPEAKRIADSAGFGKPAAEELIKVDKVAAVPAEKQQQAFDDAMKIDIYGTK